jgi:hypothetical protein
MRCVSWWFPCGVHGSIADGTGYRRAYVDAMIELAAITNARGEHARARGHAQTALELARQCQYQACTGMALTVLAESTSATATAGPHASWPKKH